MYCLEGPPLTQVDGRAGVEGVLVTVEFVSGVPFQLRHQVALQELDNRASNDEWSILFYFWHVGVFLLRHTSLLQKCLVDKIVSQ